MNKTLSKFRVEGLHNSRTIDLDISDNKLILVGENGTGKSTVANLIYYFLTSQWKRMLEVQFKSIVAVICETELYLNRQEIRELSTKLDHEVKFRIDGDSLEDHLKELALTKSENELIYESKELAKLIGIPQRVILEDLKRISRMTEEDHILLNDLRATREKFAGEILYLPTYRRIEQDIEKVLQGIDVDELRYKKHRFAGSKNKDSYIELVEFGMEDVERTITKKTTDIKESVRTDLSNLTGKYLRDVIRGAYKSADLSQLESTEETTIDKIFGRVPEEILTIDDKEKLKQIINESKATGEVTENNKVVAHFLAQLIQLNNKQQEDEKDIRDFVSVCNGYLTGKKFNYDNTQFEVTVINKSPGNTNKISMAALSSGEKQIVSLFSHLYLSGQKNSFVIIDEPELSLSVPWQKRLLPDILNKCNGFIAVTHSPFIFDNELRTYVHSLEEYTTSFEYDPSLEESSFANYDDIPF